MPERAIGILAPTPEGLRILNDKPDFPGGTRDHVRVARDSLVDWVCPGKRMETSSISIHSPPAEVISVALPGRRLPLVAVNTAFNLLWEVRRTVDKKDIDCHAAGTVRRHVESSA